mmetsp:Transcript_10732/g.18954  ORF Transcript_10732/g.18954 Transcript_10732/m.18954 type:complete len:301 (-) Transcript_10732:65-967(-)
MRSVWAMCLARAVVGILALAGAVQGFEEREPVPLAEESVVKVDCSIKGKGEFQVNVVPAWSPLGAQQFLDLVEDGYFTDMALFRAVENFLVQFGMAKDKELNRKWHKAVIADDPKIGVRIRRGSLSFAGSGPNSRSSELFVALSDRTWPGLGAEPWETPFGFISRLDMDRVWSRVNFEYGDMKPWGKLGVDMNKLWSKGYAYLEEEKPNMDYFEGCRIRAEGEGEEEEQEKTQEPVLTAPKLVQTKQPNDAKLRFQDSEASPSSGTRCEWCPHAFMLFSLVTLIGLACSILIRRKNLKAA